MKKTVFVIVGVIIIVAAIVFAAVKLATRNQTASYGSSNTAATSPTPPSAGSTGTSPTANAPVLIKYTNSGFTPVKISVKAGTRVTVLNDSSSDLQFQSDPHPTHTDNPELNVGAIGKGQEKTFAVTKSGSWGYHNHLNPSEKGTIVVQ